MKKEQLSWAMFDWAAQPFHTLIITFIFAPYFVTYVVSDPVQGQELWAFGATIAGIATILSAIATTAIADQRQNHLTLILIFSALYCFGVSLLWFSEPGRDPYVILLAFVLATIGVEVASILVNAILPKVTGPSEVGRISGFGWGIGYIGGVISLAVILIFFAQSGISGKTIVGLDPIFGLDPSTHAGTRAVGPVSAVWFVLFSFPFFITLFNLPNQKSTSKTNPLRLFSNAIGDVAKSSGYRRFLIASLFYRDGLGGFYMFGGIYAAGVLGWSITQLGIFGIIAAIFGAIGSFCGAVLDEKRGALWVIRWSICLLIAASLIAVAVRDATSLGCGDNSFCSRLPDGLFFVSGAIVGAAGGALQASSRTLVVQMSDHNKIASAFGIFAFSGRAASFLTPLAIGMATWLSGSQRLGIVPILIFLSISLLILKPVSGLDTNSG